MHRGILTTLAGSLVCVACGGSPSSPTTPSTAAPGSAPTAQLAVKADDAGSRDAIAGLSEVVADASASAGAAGLTFSIDYGDGFVASSPTARHTYSGPGTFTITATVTNAQGRRMTASQQIAVKTVVGAWFEAEYVPRNRRVEVRRLTVTAQDGLTIRGVYQVTGDADRAVTGTLSAPRSIRIAIDGGASLEGTLPGRLNDEAENWILSAHGGDALDGERLEFRAIVGDPSAPAPDADMTLRFGNGEFGEPISALTPIHIDGTRSRGAGLSYFIEFGDEFVATTTEATHVVDSPRRSLIAQLTVIDQFGRSNSESERYFPFVLNDFGDYWTSHDFPLTLIFRSRTGVNYEGDALIRTGLSYSSVPVRATLSGDRDIRVVLPTMGIEFRGVLAWLSLGNGVAQIQLNVTQTGGADDGKSGVFSLASSY